MLAKEEKGGVLKKKAGPSPNASNKGRGRRENIGEQNEKKGLFLCFDVA